MNAIQLDLAKILNIMLLYWKETSFGGHYETYVSTPCQN